MATDYGKASPAGSLIPVVYPGSAPYLVGVGDSRIEQGVHTTTTPHSPRSRSIIWWASVLSGRVSVDHRFDQGVGGSTAAEVWERIQTDEKNAFGVGASDIPRSAVVLCLFLTNDVGAAGSPTKAGIDLALSYHSRVVDWFTGRGNSVIVMSELPRSDHGAGTDNIGLLAYVASRLRRYSSRPRVVVVDAWPDLSDENSAINAALPGMLATDNLHLSTAAAYLAGKRVASALETLGLPVVAVGPSGNQDLFSASLNPTGCLNANPMMRVTAGSISGGATGTAPNSWELVTSAPTLTAAGSSASITSGGGVLRGSARIVVAGGEGAFDRSVFFKQGSLGAVLSPGDVVIAGMEFVVGAGFRGIGSPFVSLLRASAGASVVSGAPTSTDRDWPTRAVERFAGLVLTPFMTITSTTTLELRVGVKFIAPSQTASVTLDVLSGWVMRVR